MTYVRRSEIASLTFFRLIIFSFGLSAFSLGCVGSRSTSPVKPSPIKSETGKQPSNDAQNRKITLGPIIKAGGGQVNAVAFSPDGSRLAIVSGRWLQYGETQIFDLYTGDFVHTLRELNQSVICVDFAPDGASLATGGGSYASGMGHLIRIWDLASGLEKQILKGELGITFNVKYSPDGKSMASSSVGPPDGASGEIRLWDLHGGSRRLGTGEARSIALSPDGRLLATCSDSEEVLRIWNVTSGKEVRSLKQLFQSLAFSLDGKLLAGFTESGIQLYDVERLQVLHKLKRNGDDIHHLAFSPNSKVLATASGVYGSHADIRLWETTTGKLLKTFKGHKDIASAVTFAPDGKVLATGSIDGTVKLWPLGELAQ